MQTAHLLSAPRPGSRVIVVLWLAAAALMFPSHGQTKQTVCTITVNSAEEKDAFRRHLPGSRYEFVELLERGHLDWLAASCQREVACEALIVSGHFDGENHFFSERPDANEVLSVSELEQASCSDACPMLFSRLKEVYLFGCNTLTATPHSVASPGLLRRWMRETQATRQASSQPQPLLAQPGESNLDRMRQVFSGVAVIYGFPSAAPLGPVAARTLNRYLSTAGQRDIARGRLSASLLQYFAPFAMSSTVGVTDGDPRSQARQDVCQFADVRLSEASKVEFAHRLLQRPLGDIYQHLDRIQRLMASLAKQTQQAPEVAKAMRDIAGDVRSRARFLEQARATTHSPLRVRLIDIAHRLGWLSADQRWQELRLMLGELAARRDLGVQDVDLACSLNATRDLEGALFNQRLAANRPTDDVAHAALRACLGSTVDHGRTLQALLGANSADARVAQAYLRHRPITDPTELSRLVADIVGMAPSDAQVRALEALGRHHLSDPAQLASLTALFATTTSWPVQNAIAGTLIRADRRALPLAQLSTALKRNRRASPSGADMIGALASSLQAP